MAMAMGVLAAEAEQSLRKHGRRFLSALFANLQAIKLYPLENATVQRVLDDLHAAACGLLEQEGSLELRLGGGCIFLNGVRLPLDVSSYAVFDGVDRSLARCGIGVLEVFQGIERHEWAPFVSLVLETQAVTNTFETFAERLERSVQHVHVLPRVEAFSSVERTEMAKQVYLRSVQVSREILTSVRVGQAVNVRRVKRSVQSIVDQVLTNQSALLGMTTLREFDEYTFTHSVNVCILCVVFGHKLGLDKHPLYELGLCGLLHDIGKMHLEHELLNKPGSLDEGEWQRMKQHPTLGLLTLFRIHGFKDIPFRQMLAAYEHHMKMDLSGYPRVIRPRQPTLFTRIVSVVDTFDAVTSVRSYRSRPWSPDKVLKNMRDEPAWGLDKVLVKAFINTTGIYPVGTVVWLTDATWAVVVAPNPSQPLLPVIRRVADASGRPIEDAPALDLADAAAPVPAGLAIRHAVDARKHNIDVSRYIA